MTITDKVLHYTVIRQEWEESERGWGTRPDGYSLHANLDSLQRYVTQYWEGMPDDVPDEYSRPSGKPTAVNVDKETYIEVMRSENGVRR